MVITVAALRNCWEVKGCRRGPAAPPEDRCPAAAAELADGINGGQAAGRICWLVAGTLCGGQVVGAFADKQATCTACEFFAQVQAENTENFVAFDERIPLLGGGLEQLKRAHKSALASAAQNEPLLRQLLETRAELQALVSASPDGIILADGDGKISLWNPAAEEIFGYRRDEVHGKPLTMLMPEAIRADHDGHFLRRISGKNTAPLPKSVRVEGLHKDGHLVPIELSLFSWTNVGRLVIGAMIRDRTARAKRDAELARLEVALESTPDSVVITDASGTIVYVNQGFCRASGYGREQAIGQSPRVLKSGRHDQAFYRDLWETITSGETWQGELINRRSSGELYHEQATITPIIGDDGRINAYVALKRDLTEERRESQRVHELERHLERSQRLEAVGQLAAGVAHEINTPVQYISDNLAFLERACSMLDKALSAVAEVAAEDGVPELVKQRIGEALKLARVDFLREQLPRAISQSLDGTKSVATIVRALKQFSHPGTGERSAVDLNKVAERAATISRNVWKYHADLALTLAPDLPTIAGYGSDLDQLVLNLIVNAADATKETSEVKGERAKIEVITRASRRSVEIEVRDDGVGVPEELRERIFELFFTTKEVGKGTGQGLAFAQATVQKHRGTIALRSEVGKGTAFVVRLPIDPSGDDEVAERSA